MFADPPAPDVTDAVRRALAEDLLLLGDLTASLLPDDATGTAQFVSREAGRLAGTACALETFRQVDPSVSVDWRLHDGARIEARDVIAEVQGPLASILVAERTALNFLGHLSGIASLVGRFVDAAADGCRVWDTRKTTPGLRSLEKAAVRAGGGNNHRGNLSDWIMVKDNHLLGLTITEAIDRSRSMWPGRSVHIECDRRDQLVEALAGGADLVLLDNMSPDEVRECIAMVDAHEASGGRRPLVEASGGITLETIASYAQTGVDLVSSGKLTNSARVLDIGLDIETGR